MDVKAVTSSVWVSDDRLQVTPGRVTSILSAGGWLLEARLTTVSSDPGPEDGPLSQQQRIITTSPL